MSMSASLDRLVHDLRFGARVLIASPVFTAVAILSLGLGIGANSAIFSIVHAVLLEALPVEDPAQLVQINVGDRQSLSTNPIWEHIRDREGEMFDGTFAFSRTRFDVAPAGERQYVEGLYVSGEFFTTLGVRPFSGRTLTRDDDRRGGGAEGPVAVLSYDYWRDRHRSSPDVVGASIRLDGHLFTIVGVTPPGFYGVSVGSRFDVAVPLAAEALIRGDGSMLDRRGNWWVTVMARLAPGTRLEQAQVALRTQATEIREATMPPGFTGNMRDGYLAEPFTLTPATTGDSSLRTSYRTALLTLTGSVALVLLIACANLANLSLARASARRGELAVRLALGASRAQLVRQLLTESLLLALAGAAAGLLFAQWAGRLVVRQISSARVPVFIDLSIDWTVLGFTTALSAIAVCIFGLLPALRSTDLRANTLLKSGSRSVAAGWRGLNLEKGLVIVQIAFSLVLVVGAALFVRSFASLAWLDPGFDRRDVLILTVDARGVTRSREQRLASARRLLEAFRALPGVRSAASTAQVPITNNTWMSTARVGGREDGVFMNRVSAGYFTTMGTPIYAGRDFGDLDAPTTPRVVIVNEAFARTFFSRADPVGQTFELADSQQAGPLRIVGVVKDAKYLDLRQAAPPTAYLAAGQAPSAPRYFVLRGAGDTATLGRSALAAALGLSSDLAIEVRVFDTLVSDSLVQERLLALVSSFFGTLALLVAGIGLYGVMSLAVSQRRNEIGIRMALGAEPAFVVRMVLRDVASVAAIGLALGIVSGLLSARLLRTLLFGVEPSDLSTWAIAVATLTVAVGVAGYLPARRASRLDPMLALRQD